MCVCGGGGGGGGVGGCLDYSKTNEQIFIKNLWVGPDRRKKLLKDLDLIMDTKNPEFSEVPFQCIFNDFSFLLDIYMKITSCLLHVWFYFIVFLTILYIT